MSLLLLQTLLKVSKRLNKRENGKNQCTMPPSARALKGQGIKMVGHHIAS
jgi:hypothetical protein